MRRETFFSVFQDEISILKSVCRENAGANVLSSLKNQTFSILF